MFSETLEEARVSIFEDRFDIYSYKKNQAYFLFRSIPVHTIQKWSRFIGFLSKTVPRQVYETQVDTIRPLGICKETPLLYKIYRTDG